MATAVLEYKNGFFRKKEIDKPNVKPNFFKENDKQPSKTINSSVIFMEFIADNRVDIESVLLKTNKSIYHNLDVKQDAEEFIGFFNENLIIKSMHNNNQLLKTTYDYNPSLNGIYRLTNNDYSSQTNSDKYKLFSDTIEVMDQTREETRKMTTVENIEKKISSTYKVATIGLFALSLISLLSIIGLNFIPHPIDTVLLITSFGGATGFLIDNAKRKKINERF